eukprot:TRINITY_DN334_c1_g2_i3.p1 TRINITY_DN334_c1_g2~~TRINITY_DN334_c1_g2_i3.p1  ORF type:complete len:725 (+),score=335.34 TRINITY_DN334_c1_g2_i3:100-2175(+)
MPGKRSLSISPTKNAQHFESEDQNIAKRIKITETSTSSFEFHSESIEIVDVKGDSDKENEKSIEIDSTQSSSQAKKKPAPILFSNAPVSSKAKVLASKSSSSSPQKEVLSEERERRNEEKRIEKEKKLEEKKKKEEERLKKLEEKKKKDEEKEEERKRKEEEKRKKEEEKKKKEEEKEEEKKRKEEEKVKKEEEKKRKEEEKSKKEEERLKKLEEKKKKDEEKEEEKKRKEEEKKRKEEEKEEERKRKEEKAKKDNQKSLFSFGVSVVHKEVEAKMEIEDGKWYFPINLSGLDWAPLHRSNSLSMEEIDSQMADENKTDTNQLLEEFKTKKAQKSRGIKMKRVNNYKTMKLFGNPSDPEAVVRPSYWGLWEKTSKIITGRKPFALDSQQVNYEEDSEDEWEGEPEDAEDLGKSDGEEEETDDSETEDNFVVADGYFSDDEGIIDEEGLSKEELEHRKRERENSKKKEKSRLPELSLLAMGPTECKEDHPIMSHLRVQILSTVPIDLFTKQKKEHAVEGEKKIRFPREDLISFIKFVHGNPNSKEHIVKEFAQQVPTVSKNQTRTKITEIASIRQFPDSRLCFVVNEDVLREHELENLPLGTFEKKKRTPKKTRADAPLTEYTTNLVSGEPEVQRTLFGSPSKEPIETPKGPSPSKISPQKADLQLKMNALKAFSTGKRVSPVKPQPMDLTL